MNSYEASTLGIFLKKVAYDYARYGYTEYALRAIPEGADVREVCGKLLREYRVTYCHTERARRRRDGKANVVLVVHRRWFVLMGSPGTHETFSRIVRRNLQVWPLHFMGYSVGLKGGVPEVLIAPRRWKRVRELGLRIALDDHAKVTDFFHRFLNRVSPFKFPGVARQKEKLLREVNERRRRAGLRPVEAPEGWWGRDLSYCKH